MESPMTRNHGDMGSRYLIDATVEGQERRVVLFAPLEPTRRRSPDLSAYDRLDPPRPVRPRRYGSSRVEDLAGMDRLRAALDLMSDQVNAAAAEAARVSAEEAMRKSGYHSGGNVKVDPVPPAALDRGESIMGLDLSVSPDRTVMGFRWPDGSIRTYSHKRSETFW